MQRGKIKKVIRERGFGFISATDGREIFFHQSALEGVQLDALNDGQEVEFDVEKSDKGPRAIKIHIVQS